MTTTLDFFTPHLDTVFTAVLDGDLLFPLTLFEAGALPSHPYPGQVRAPFQLRFRGENTIFLHQRIHRLRHEALGELEIFLVPIGEEAGRFIYQAVYN
ncbi:DUF6916 family protein [Methylogaea oryzae]|uniref:DUF6916 domain-containing protein n=1 Tax=Methylogaea oryzae TaxID=1295382 RepID=A0A8D5AKX3_9GAMM|nr:hypothetical protein [Methylogaea oryzae]BBL69585.1 hypothetical protein MoryE10_01910 [Methylogaea oryzae]